MIIGHMAKITAKQLPAGLDLGFFLVAVLALGNAAGRIVAGIVADRIGGVRTMTAVFVTQAALMGLAFSATPLALVPVAVAVGFCYGANLSLFPSTTAGFFGTKNLGVNYGLVFTAWGMGGVFGSMTAGTIVDSTGSYGLAYAVALPSCACWLPESRSARGLPVRAGSARACRCRGRPDNAAGRPAAGRKRPESGGLTCVNVRAIMGGGSAEQPARGAPCVPLGMPVPATPFGPHGGPESGGVVQGGGVCVARRRVRVHRAVAGVDHRPPGRRSTPATAR